MLHTTTFVCFSGRECESYFYFFQMNKSPYIPRPFNFEFFLPTQVFYWITKRLKYLNTWTEIAFIKLKNECLAFYTFYIIKYIFLHWIIMNFQLNSFQHWIRLTVVQKNVWIFWLSKFHRNNLIFSLLKINLEIIAVLWMNWFGKINTESVNGEEIAINF